MPPDLPIVWTDIALLPEARERLDAHATLLTQPEGTLSGIETADAVIAGSRFPGTAETFARAARLQVVARVGIGYDRIDLAAATAAGVCVVNTPDAPTESTAEFAIALMLAAARRLPRALAGLAAGRWEQGAELAGTDLAGKTLGLVGCGRIGRRVAEIAQALRMSVQAHDPHAAELPPGVGRAATLHGLLQSSDVISVHAPLTPATHRLLGPAEFAVVRRGAILVNTARGGLVDETALLAALDDGRIGAAGLDVWDPEPPAMDHPLLRRPGVVATPHIAAFTQEGRRRSHLAATAQALAVLAGECPPALLNPAVWAVRRRAQ